MWSSWAPLAMAEPEFRDFACDVVLVHLFRGAVLLGSRLPHTHRPCAMVHRKLQIRCQPILLGFRALEISGSFKQLPIPNLLIQICGGPVRRRKPIQPKRHIQTYMYQEHPSCFGYRAVRV